MITDPRLQLMARLMDVAAFKAQVHAGNIANQNTPGFKAQAVRFDEAFQTALEQGGTAAAAQIEPEVYEPRDTMEQSDGNDVSLNREIIGSAKNQTLYSAYLAMTKGKMRLLNIAASNAPGG